MMRKRSQHFVIITISLIIIATVMAILINNRKHVLLYKDRVHPGLLYLIANFNNLDVLPNTMRINDFANKRYLSKQMLLSNDTSNHFYFLVNFFKINEQLFFNLRLVNHFPTVIPSINSIIRLNLKQLYYFQLGNVNILIYDYPNSNGHGLYSKKSQYNFNAMRIKRYEDEIYEFGSRSFPQEISKVRTYKVVDDSLIQIDNIYPIKNTCEEEIKVVDSF